MGEQVQESVDEVVAAARRLLAAVDAGQRERIVRAGQVTLDRATRWLHWPSGRVRLGRSAVGLAAELMQHPGETLPRATLLASIGWYADPAATRSLDTAVSRLRKRLPGRIIALDGYGYRWSPPR